ncbi:MAG TPA: ATP-binding protein, partial [Anaerolineae bacterium]|nr:ATP-binding protein [Anaerolineae bacterium]
LLTLRNARLYTALQSEVTERQRLENRFWASLHKTETLYHTSRTLNAPYFSDSVLLEVTNQVAAAIHADQVLLVSLDTHNRRVRHFIVGGTGGGQVVPLSYDELVEGLTGRVLREGLPALLQKTEAQARATEHGLYWYKGLYTGSIAAAPLFARSQVFGVLMAVNRAEQPDFVQADLDLLLAIAAQVAITIQNAQLFQAVTEERSRLRALIQSSRDGIILLGLDMHVLVINRPALDLLKLPGDPVSWGDQWFWDALSRLYEHSPQAVDVILSEVRRVQAGDARSGEGEMQVGARIIHWLNLPVLETERAVGRLFVLQDVTEARLLERFREDLTHTMVHDLRNPLSGIYAGLRLLSTDYDSVFTQSHHRILEAAQDSVQRMLRLVGAILDINRLESGKMPLSLTLFDFTVLLEDVLAMQAPIAAERQLTLGKEVSPDLPQVRADRDLVERVLQNLVGNALKFTPAGGTVGVRVVIPTTPACKLQVSVSDTGPGIPEDVRKRLFQKFVTGSHQERGSGLGLAFCRMALEAHGERIWVVETSGGGSTFAFTLPLPDCD